MNDIAISVDGLGKQYRIDQDAKASYDTLGERISDAFAAPFRRLFRSGNSHRNTQNHLIWALENVSFEIAKGDVVGIIGRNGAGKSTLLKILSRITEPTTGTVRVYGRVGSLLEVGTGFHPELSGRDNVYLNGAILGMKKSEIDRKFDEIVSFAELHKFIDTPVKFYSSGMYVRLAFAVAAHMETETLLVDEVLAVGDASFQKKCLGKMSDVAKEGRTVLFVSHNMGMISRLTQTCCLLEGGKVYSMGPSADVVTQYFAFQSQQNLFDGEDPLDPRDVVLAQARIVSENSETVPLIRYASSFCLETVWKSKVYESEASFHINVYAADGTKVATMNSTDFGIRENLYPDEVLKVTWNCDTNALVPGMYYLSLYVDNRTRTSISTYDQVLKLEVSGVGSPDRLARSRRVSNSGYIVLPGAWKIEQIYN